MISIGFGQFEASDRAFVLSFWLFCSSGRLSVFFGSTNNSWRSRDLHIYCSRRLRALPPSMALTGPLTCEKEALNCGHLAGTARRYPPLRHLGGETVLNEHNQNCTSYAPRHATRASMSAIAFSASSTHRVPNWKRAPTGKERPLAETDRLVEGESQYKSRTE